MVLLLVLVHKLGQFPMEVPFPESYLVVLAEVHFVVLGLNVILFVILNSGKVGCKFS